MTEPIAWRKARLSFSNSNCVEVAVTLPGLVSVRNSRHPDGPWLGFTEAEWHAFLDGAKRGEFDDLT